MCATFFFSLFTSDESSNSTSIPTTFSPIPFPSLFQHIHGRSFLFYFVHAWSLLPYRGAHAECISAVVFDSVRVIEYITNETLPLYIHKLYQRRKILMKAFEDVHFQGRVILMKEYTYCELLTL